MGQLGRFEGISKPFKQWFVTRITPHLPGAWRTAALVNTILITIVAILMTIFSIVALLQAGGFNRPLVIYTGTCGISGAPTLNTVLHIIINVLSTAILASSNMFMQILNAPSREEVVKSHTRGSWLEIGVLSGRNIFQLSPFKSMAWLGFLASSIPIHLLFNSTIFETSYRFSNYDLAIVAEPFLHGGHYYTPGASLLSSGGLNGYGDFVNLIAYQNSTSAINEDISSTAQFGGSWTRINKKACKQEYHSSCSGLSAHSDVVLVVASTDGWPRSQIWDLTGLEDLFWDAYVPDDASESEHNSLWFYGNCHMSAVSSYGLTSCENSCINATGGVNPSQDWILPFYPDTFTASGVARHSMRSSLLNSSVYNFEYNNLDIDYCLARPVQELCKVALSTTLLVSVTGCAILKAALCVWVYYRLGSQKLLTTPGDAIDSFISEPDPYTAEMCLLSQGEIRMRLLCGNPQPGPRQYRQRARKLGAAVPFSEWFFLLLTMSGALAATATLTIVLGAGLGGM